MLPEKVANTVRVRRSRQTRYCNKTCQHDHWRRGHKQICKKIHRGGNAEQYHADKKYKEAVAVAVEACADDTKGQTCYICTQALHWKTKEGLVRMCACRGTAGLVHLSCLAEQAKILFEEAEANNLDWDAKNARFDRWHWCSLCEQEYHGVVKCALGWACWKSYVGRPEADMVRQMAMNVLGLGLSEARHDEDALAVQEAELATMLRLGADEEGILITRGNIAMSYRMLGRLEDALRMRRDIYSGWLRLEAENHNTFREANNYASSLIHLQHYAEARSLLRRTIPVARRVLGESNEITLNVRWNYAIALGDPTGTLDDLREAVTMFEEMVPNVRRVLGGSNPTTLLGEEALRDARAALRAREATQSSGGA